MRAFFAVGVSEDNRRRVVSFQRELEPLAPSARWVPPENLHVTLRFVGQLDAQAVGRLLSRLRPAVAELPPFTMELAGCGAFPSPRRARAVWVGVDGPGLLPLHEAVERCTRAEGLEPDERAFRPHLTIARLKAPSRALPAALPEHEGRRFGAVDITELLLFESKLSPGGARYLVRDRLPLAGTSGL